VSNIKFIAEVSSNHNRDLERMKKFIKTASDIGCTGVKFQLFKIDQLFASEILEKSEIHRNRKNWELPEEVIPELADYTHEFGLNFSCSPFYLDAVDLLEPYVDFYKIASYELLWFDLFNKCSETGKPIVFSVGMATLDEIENALGVLSKGNTTDVTILHCNSAYPTSIKDANLKAIEILRNELKQWDEKFNLSIGWSDHTVSSAVMNRAVNKYDVNFIEFHLDLDAKGEEFSAGHCWLPDQIAEVISNVNAGFTADGDGGIEPSPSELPDRDWRADPNDGLRPIKHLRKDYIG